MSSLTSYAVADGIATITLDDGKANALSAAMLAEIAEQLGRARDEEAMVLLTGRAQTFSAGFDIRTVPDGWQPMVLAGARLTEQLLAFPHPTIVACNGNAIAMGAFVLLGADVRVGVRGDFRIGLNETALGLTIPMFGIAAARHRLQPPFFDRCCITGELLNPEEAQTAGFLDHLVEPEALMVAARSIATQLRGLHSAAHTANKLRVREAALAGVRDGITRLEGDGREW